MEKHYSTYILTNKPYGTLYIGVTNNLAKRIYQHKRKEAEGFTKKYNIDKLVYHETCNDINAAIQREKQLKRWNRQWKINLIEEQNPKWRDLYYDIAGEFDSNDAPPSH